MSAVLVKMIIDQEAMRRLVKDVMISMTGGKNNARMQLAQLMMILI
jgi:hypothetical protein